MSDYLTNKVVQLYFETIMQYNLRETDVETVKRKGNVVVIDTKKKLYVKSIKR